MSRGASNRQPNASCRALRLEPDLAAAHLNLGNALRALRQSDEAAACFRKALELQPGYAKAHANLSSIYLDQQRLDEALQHGEAAFRSDPTLAEAQANLSAVEYQRGYLSAAVWHARKPCALSRAWRRPRVCSARAFQDQGQTEEALACSEPALESSAPNEQPRTHSNLLFCLQHLPHITSQQLLEAHRRWDRQYALPLAEQCQSPGPQNHDRAQPLRLGLVSADLGCHPVGQFVQGWLEHLDRRRIEGLLLLGSSHRRHDEPASANACIRLVDVQTMDDESLAARIRNDRINVLCDLAGHTAAAIACWCCPPAGAGAGELDGLRRHDRL